VIVIKLACGLNSVAGVLALFPAVLQVLMSSDSERRSFSKVLQRFVVVAKATPTSRRSLALLALVLLTV
jgi:hypothetical protein